METNDEGIKVLSLKQLAERWKLSEQTVRSYWRTGRIPAPMNRFASRGYRWPVTVIEAFEQANGDMDGAA